MPIIEGDTLHEDRWQRVPDDAPLPDAPALLSLERLRRDAGPLAGRNAPLGVELPPETSPDAIADWLPRLALVAVRLPKSRDGRAFTQARSLREYHGYAGEIRAVGHVLPDHYAMLLRCGVSSVEVPEGADPAVWAASRRVVDIAYQPGQATEDSLGLLRRRVSA